MIAETSQQAYDKLKDRLGSKQERVYEAIKKLGRATNENVADFLGWPINQVTGRVTELRKMGFIVADGIGQTKLGNSAKIFTIVDLNDRNLFELAQDCED